MAYVVTENCVDCRFTDCVEVCPVDCFYGDPKQLYIHPDECIECGACEFACPVKAIFNEDDLPPELRNWIGINADKTLSGEAENITASTDPLPTAAAKKSRLGF